MKETAHPKYSFRVSIHIGYEAFMYGKYPTSELHLYA